MARASPMLDLVLGVAFFAVGWVVHSQAARIKERLEEDEPIDSPEGVEVGALVAGGSAVAGAVAGSRGLIVAGTGFGAGIIAHDLVYGSVRRIPLRPVPWHGWSEIRSLDRP